MINEFISEYTSQFPDECLPSVVLIDELLLESTISIVSSNNIMLLVEYDDHYDVTAHWCLANRTFSSSRNSKAFLEVLRFVKSLTKPVYIDNLNIEYYKATSPVLNSTYRSF